MQYELLISTSSRLGFLFDHIVAGRPVAPAAALMEIAASAASAALSPSYAHQRSTVLSPSTTSSDPSVVHAAGREQTIMCCLSDMAIQAPLLLPKIILKDPASKLFKAASSALPLLVTCTVDISSGAVTLSSSSMRGSSRRSKKQVHLTGTAAVSLSLQHATTMTALHPGQLGPSFDLQPALSKGSVLAAKVALTSLMNKQPAVNMTPAASFAAIRSPSETSATAFNLNPAALDCSFQLGATCGQGIASIAAAAWKAVDPSTGSTVQLMVPAAADCVSIPVRSCQEGALSSKSSTSNLATAGSIFSLRRPDDSYDPTDCVHAVSRPASALKSGSFDSKGFLTFDTYLLLTGSVNTRHMSETCSVHNLQVKPLSLASTSPRPGQTLGVRAAVPAAATSAAEVSFAVPLASATDEGLIADGIMYYVELSAHSCCTIAEDKTVAAEEVIVTPSPSAYTTSPLRQIPQTMKARKDLTTSIQLGLGASVLAAIQSSSALRAPASGSIHAEVIETGPNALFEAVHSTGFGSTPLQESLAGIVAGLVKTANVERRGQPPIQMSHVQYGNEALREPTMRGPRTAKSSLKLSMSETPKTCMETKRVASSTITGAEADNSYSRHERGSTCFLPVLSYLHRVRPAEASGASPEYRLVPRPPGALSSLVPEAVPPARSQDQQMTVRVKAVGLNFRDLLVVRRGNDAIGMHKVLARLFQHLALCGRSCIDSYQEKQQACLLLSIYTISSYITSPFMPNHRY
jgi:hypothetical protein